MINKNCKCSENADIATAKKEIEDICYTKMQRIIDKIVKSNGEIDDFLQFYHSLRKYESRLNTLLIQMTCPSNEKTQGK